MTGARSRLPQLFCWSCGARFLVPIGEVECPECGRDPGVGRPVCGKESCPCAWHDARPCEEFKELGRPEWQCAQCGWPEPEHNAVQPRRIQRSRQKGWRKPPNTIIVTRPSRWGNPFRVGHEAVDAAHAVELYRRHVEVEGLAPKIRAELAGRDLACWCAEGAPCHGSLLLAIANGVES